MAFSSETGPAYSPPAVATFHVAELGSGCQLNGADMYVVALGSMPCSIAVASVIVLNVEPGWRRPCDARSNWSLRK